MASRPWKWSKSCRISRQRTSRRASAAKALLREDRALLTLDTDFASISEYDPRDYPGLVVLRTRRQDSGSIHTLVTSLVQHLHAHELRGHLWILEPDRVRIRG